MRVLHVIHDFLPRHRAGSELYVHHLCQELRRRDEVAVLCAEYDPAQAHGTLVRRELEGVPVFELINNWSFRSFEESYRSPLLNERIGAVLDELRPDVVHVHNLLNLSLDVPLLAEQRGIPSVATLHDYTYLCPSGGQRIHLAESYVCEELDVSRCARCFTQSPFHAQLAAAKLTPAKAASPLLEAWRAARRRFPALEAPVRAALARVPLANSDAGAMDQRLNHAMKALRAFRVVVAPSPSIAREYHRLGFLGATLRVSDYGFVPLSPPKRARRGRPVVGFVGTLAWHKGVHVLVEAVRELADLDFEVRVHGDLETFPPYSAKLRAAAEGLPISFMGGFDPARASQVYGSVDVLVVPSLWPENSPLVIHEAFMAGIPVIGANSGGIADLVEHGRNGLLYPPSSPSDLAAALRQVLTDAKLRRRLAAAVPAVKSIAQDANEWREVYSAVAANRVAQLEVAKRRSARVRRAVRSGGVR